MSAVATSWRQAPPPVRAIAVAVLDAVAAARAEHREVFDDAVAQLAAQDPTRVQVLLGDVVRMLLEATHLDGLSGDDVATVLDGCVRSAAPWFPEVDPGVLVVLLVGALGVHGGEEDEPREITALEVAQHAPLLVADLLAFKAEPLDGYLDAAVAELARTQTIEMP